MDLLLVIFIRLEIRDDSCEGANIITFEQPVGGERFPQLSSGGGDGRRIVWGTSGNHPAVREANKVQSLSSMGENRV